MIRAAESGENVCGLLAIKPERFGVQNNLVTNAKNFGRQIDIHDAVDITTNARFGNGGLITGGLSLGKTVTDNCEILEQLPEMAGVNTAALRTCRVDPPIGAGTQLKISGAYNLPWDLRVSANYQNNPGIETTATYVATNAEIRPSLGRDLAAGARATANVELITPQSVFREGRITQLNFAVDRVFRMDTPAFSRGSSCTTRPIRVHPRHQSALRPHMAAGAYRAGAADSEIRAAGRFLGSRQEGRP